MGSAGWMASSGRGPLAVGGRSGFHSLAPSALGMTEAARRPATAAGNSSAVHVYGNSLSTSTSLTSKVAQRAASPGVCSPEQFDLADAVAMHNLGESQIHTLLEKLQDRPQKVERSMRQRGIQTVIEKCERPGGTSLQDTIARALWRLESSRALSDAIVDKRR
jgi:hypothetical protein